MEKTRQIKVATADIKATELISLKTNAVQWQQAPKHIFKNGTGVWNHFQPGGFSVTKYDYATA